MNAPVAAGVLPVLLLWVLTPGCDGPVSGTTVANRATAPQWRDGGKVVLGSPELTSGLPGEGPLAIEEIRDWLSQDGVHEPLEFELPVGLQDAATLVSVPPENPLTRAKIELGRQLFFDKRLSRVGDVACATCHMPEQDYSIHGVLPDNRLNPPVAFNRIFSTRQSWDGRDESLEQQIHGPVTNQFEMGTTTEDSAKRIASIEGYRIQFQAIFGKVDFESIAAALGSFQRALVTGASPWDYRRLLRDYEKRDPESHSEAEQQLIRRLRDGVRTHPMSEAAIRGEALFFSDRTGCYSCHPGATLTDEAFYNIGTGGDPDELGRYEVTGVEADRFAFKTPTLRNIARTSPYMHNGQFDTLTEVIDWFDRGEWDHASAVRKIRRLDLSRDEKRDLVAFLEALSGPLPVVETERLPE